MAEFVLLKKLLCRPKKFGFSDIGGVYINYKPDEATVVLEPQKTGYHSYQIVRTAKNLSWLAFMHNGYPYLVSKNTVDLISMYGIKARKYAGGMLEEKGKKLYSDSVIGAEGGFVSGRLLMYMPDNLVQMAQEYFLASGNLPKGISRDLQYVDQYRSIRKFGDLDRFDLSLRPYAKLKKETMVDISNEFYNGSCPERGLQIKK